MSDVHELKESDLPEPYQPEWEKLKIEDDYGKASFELLKEAGELVAWLVHGIPATPFQRNEAIRRGLIKRLCLLGKSLVSDASHNSGYQQLQITRQLVEVAASYFYLVGDDKSGARHNAYINQSLAEEKNNLVLISQQIKKRGDDPLPIETRMQASIDRVAGAADVELESVPKKSESGWPTSERLLKELGPTAYPAYRAGSSALHGGWSTLFRQDLTQVDECFSLEGNESRPRVQTMGAAGTVITGAAIHYLNNEGTKAEKIWFLARLEDVSERIHKLDNEHEKFSQAA